MLLFTQIPKREINRFKLKVIEREGLDAACDLLLRSAAPLPPSPPLPAPAPGQQGAFTAKVVTPP